MFGLCAHRTAVHKQSRAQNFRIMKNLTDSQLIELQFYLKQISAILGLDTQVLPSTVSCSAVSHFSNLPIPQLDKNGRPSYREIYEYIRSRKRCDPDFNKICKEESTASVCRRLSDIFGWDVDDNSLRQYLGRKQKYLTIATIK